MLDAHYVVDVVSSASIDVVSAATGRFHELRNEAEGGASYGDGTRNIGVSYIYSREHDWASHTVTAGVSHDFLGHDITFAMGGSYVANSIWRAHDTTFKRSLAIVSGNTQLVFVPGPDDIFSIDYSFSYNNGYQASPYRFARFVNSAISGQLFWQPEVHPETRKRHAVTLRHNHHMFTDSALRSHARAYRDDWGVQSITAGTEYVVGFDATELGISVRGYAQRHARFYQDVYDGVYRYMTSDREMSTFYDAFCGLRLARDFADAGPFSNVRVEVKVTGFVFDFPEFSRLPSRVGGIGEFGLEGTF